MQVLEVVYKFADVSVAVAALLFVGWRVEVQFSRVLENQNNLLNKLLEICAGDDND